MHAPRADSSLPPGQPQPHGQVAETAAAAPAAAAPDKRASAAARWAAALAFISVGRATELVPFLSGVPLAKIVFAGLVIAAIGAQRRASSSSIWAIPLARTATIFVALTVASLAFSIWKSNSLEFVIQSWSTIVIAFFVALKVLRSWADARAVLKAFAWAGLILGAEAVVSYGGGRAQVGRSYDTNDLAYVLIGVLPIALAFGVGAAGLRRLFWLGVAGVELIAALLTQSRGGLVALAVVVALLVWNPLPRRDADRSTNRGRRMRRALLVAILGVIVWVQLPAGVQQRLASVVTPAGDYNIDTRNEMGRISVWTRNVAAGARRPIGYGIASMPAVDGLTGGRYLTAHNSLVQVFVELGVLGLILWLRLWYLGWQSLAPPVRPAAPDAAIDSKEWSEQVLFCRALRLSLVALFAAGFFLSQAYSLLLWQVLAVCGALSAVFANREVSPAPRKLQRTVPWLRKY